MSYTAVFSSIMGKSSFGLLIDLGIQNYVPIDQAIMYYNYIGIFFVVLWAMFASASNESRYTFTTPLMAAVMVWIGWLHAVDAVQYWGMILMMMLLGALMYMNDMNHEKSGLPGPGDKMITMAVMIMCFTASYGFILSPSFGLFSEAGAQAGSTQNQMCGTAYTCDASGNVVLGASVSQVTSSGGLGLDIVSVGSILLTMMVTGLKMLIIIAASVVLFSVVILAAYPALLDSPQAIAFLAVLNVVIWVVYAMAWFRLTYKPMGTGGDI
jgi:hypothetical protein